jgi:hypothetical protein
MSDDGDDESIYLDAVAVDTVQAKRWWGAPCTCHSLSNYIHIRNQRLLYAARSINDSK